MQYFLRHSYSNIFIHKKYSVNYASYVPSHRRLSTRYTQPMPSSYGWHLCERVYHWSYHPGSTLKRGFTGALFLNLCFSISFCQCPFLNLFSSNFLNSLCIIYSCMNLESDRQISNKTDLDARYILGPLEITLSALSQLLGVASTDKYALGVRYGG